MRKVCHDRSWNIGRLRRARWGPGPYPLYQCGSCKKKDAKEMKEKFSLLQDAVRRMHEADASYGCGFYNDKDWIRAYVDTYRLVIGPDCPSYDHPDDSKGSDVTVINTESTCPACKKNATCSFVFTGLPPIYVWSCGCHIQYRDRGLDVGPN